MATSEHTPPASADASASAHPPADTGRAARVGLWALGLGFGGFLLWAGLAPLDEGVPSQGTVMIDTKRKTVQHLSGGIIRQVMVHEGQHVQEGQPLLELDAATMRANFESVRQRYLSLRAMQGRLQAEQADKDSISFHPDLQEAKVDPADPSANANAKPAAANAPLCSLRVLRCKPLKKAFKSQQAMLQTYDAMLTQRRSQLALVQDELGNTRSLVAEGYAPRNRQLELERQLADIQTAIVELLGNTQRAQRAVAELRQQSQVRRQEYRKEVETQLAEVLREVQSDAEKLNAVRADLARTEIRSPATGQVIGLAVQTVGGADPGRTKLADIVPEDEPFAGSSHRSTLHRPRPPRPENRCALPTPSARPRNWWCKARCNPSPTTCSASKWAARWCRITWHASRSRPRA